MMNLLLLAPWGTGEWAIVAASAVALGIVLLAVEILVIPGFGFVGLLGIGSTIAGGILAWTRLGPLWGVVAILVSAVAGALMVWAFPRTRVGRKVMLAQSVAGFRAPAEGLESLIGREGTAITTLRPAGTIEIGDRRVDVVTDGQFVDAGTAVRVIRVEGARVVVEAIQTES